MGLRSVARGHKPWRRGFAISGLNRRLLTLLMIAATLVALAFILLPVYWMLKSSFQSNLEIQSVPPTWFPESFTFEAYERASILIPIWRYLANSTFISAATAVIATIVACMASYVLARHRFPGAAFILILILLTQLIPGITRVFPIYFMIQSLGLLNTFTGAIFAYVGFSIPYAVLLLRGYFKSSSPPELEEAALVDGCTFFSAFWRIILPVSLPGIAAVATFTFLNAWNDFLWASLLLNQGDMRTIQVGIGSFAGESGSLRYISAFMASCVLATIPALVVFLFLQRWLVGGLTAGSVKS